MEAFISATFFTLISTTNIVLSATIIEDLSQQPPSNFTTFVSNNCLTNPSLRYCNYSPSDIADIYKSIVVAKHLCNESGNSNCDENFTKIDLQNRPKIAPLYLSFAFFWKYCPLTVLTIDFSNNSLKGDFPIDVLFCSQIFSLDLSNNELHGEVPIDNFSLLINLKYLNLSYNSFSEIKTQKNYLLEHFNSSSFLHSGLLSSDHSHGFRLGSIIFLMCLLLFVVFVVGGIWYICFQRPDYLPPFCHSQYKYTPAMLEAATNGFSEENLIGKSGKTEIYRGALRDGSEISIEIQRWQASREFRKEFVKESNILVQLCHKNFVKVLGWCDRREMRAVVTEYIGRHSLEKWLKDEFPPWNHRFKVLIEVVEAMYYLHKTWPEIGIDLQTNRILLLENRTPLISRFKLVSPNNDSTKLYRYGVFLLEMVSNKRPRKDFERGEMGFMEWIKSNYPGKAWKVIDEKMKMSHTWEQIMHVLDIAMICTDPKYKMHPKMEDIYDMIKKVQKSSLVGASRPTKRMKRENN